MSFSIDLGFHKMIVKIMIVSRINTKKFAYLKLEVGNFELAKLIKYLKYEGKC